MSLPFTANCTFIRPTTLSALAICTVWRRSSSWFFFDRLYGGTREAESPEHVRGTHLQRVAYFFGQLDGLVRRACRGVGWLQQFQLLDQLLEAFTILSDVDGIRRGADDRRAVFLQRTRQLERCLAAGPLDHDLGLFELDHLEHVFQGERLEAKQAPEVVLRPLG